MTSVVGWGSEETVLLVRLLLAAPAFVDKVCYIMLQLI